MNSSYPKATSGNCSNVACHSNNGKQLYGSHSLPT
ncbi:MAG: CxxxxCH/CxxCH domain-containing protein [Pirellulales bacterium]